MMDVLTHVKRFKTTDQADVKAENGAAPELVRKIDHSYCTGEKVAPNCPVCRGSGQYDGGKCDGFPF